MHIISLSRLLVTHLPCSFLFLSPFFSCSPMSASECGHIVILLIPRSFDEKPDARYQVDIWMATNQISHFNCNFRVVSLGLSLIQNSHSYNGMASVSITQSANIARRASEQRQTQQFLPGTRNPKYERLQLTFASCNFISPRDSFVSSPFSAVKLPFAQRHPIQSKP